MKLTYLRFEGTPEELDASEVVRELVQQLPGTVDTARPTPRVVADPDSDDVVDFGWQVEGDVPGVADEGQETVKAQLAFNPAAQQFIDFMAETGSWKSVGGHGIKRKTWQEGDPLDYSGYLAARAASSAVSPMPSRPRAWSTFVCCTAMRSRSWRRTPIRSQLATADTG
ncbi:hypothetical protein [Streptomyces coeruleorubidus]|uniref:hypothetical protein n=1 Tax=Streptomyces coeruleorubidus TaxID=116188 RepID=UPI0033BE272D